MEKSVPSEESKRLNDQYRKMCKSLAREDIQKAMGKNVNRNLWAMFNRKEKSDIVIKDEYGKVEY